MNELRTKIDELEAECKHLRFVVRDQRAKLAAATKPAPGGSALVAAHKYVTSEREATCTTACMDRRAVAFIAGVAWRESQPS